jgi:amino acid adenylation domain-containing protein
MAYLLTQLLSESAKLYPEKPAVWARGRTLSYRELEEKSNQLAHLLRESGVKKGDRIGLYFPKAVESIVCMFGVMKAGGVYVPLDPAAPTQRIAYIIGDCGVTGLITTCEKLTGLEPAGIGSVKFKIATDAYVNGNPCSDAIHWSTLAKFPVSYAPVNESVTTDLAYILYTSGSTGRPKGVMLSHLNALTFVEWCAETFQVRSEDRLSNHAPHHFDLSVFDIYNTIKAGATVYMIPDEVSLFPASLAKFIDEQGITVWYSVPSALVYLVLHGNLKGQNLQGLRTILFAGEVFPMKYLRQLAELVPNAGLYNLYGPTETNVCTYYEVERERLESMKNIPIGKACTNTEVFAVNDRDELARQGEEGELWVRGPSVTPGYWGDPEKTKRGVVANRFQPHFEEKAYRTGDLVTLEADGNYYYVGRRDSMIKSRGYRIELGEIEAALLSHPGVMEAAAVAVPDEEIGSRIKAIVAPHNSHKLTPVELQRHCASRIPKYMIPELIELRPSLPKTSTGKLDRVRLAQGAVSPNA